MKKVRIAIILASMTMGVATAMADELEEKKDSTGFVFTDVRVIESTPVRDQNKSGTCWCFSGTTFIEDEIIRKGGKPVDLSEMYTVRHCYADKADRYMRLNGKGNFTQGGSILDVIYSWKRYGIVPEEVYRGLNYGEDNHMHSELEGGMKAFLDAVNRNPSRRLSTAWPAALNGILDAYFGVLPETFDIDGSMYTPISYAASLGVNVDDYIPLTSFIHQPFYEEYAIEVPDNWLWAGYHNLPLDELKAVIDNAVENGFPVVWAADVSEQGFKWKKGVALMPKAKNEADMEGTELARWVKLTDAEKKDKQYDFNGPVEEIEVTPEVRQSMFDRRETTDDHGMEIVGYATDQNGKRYYKVRNSWTDNQVYGGHLYVSEAYVLAKTIDVLVHRDAIPKAIAAKLNLKK